MSAALPPLTRLLMVAEELDEIAAAMDAQDAASMAQVLREVHAELSAAPSVPSGEETP